MPKFSGTAAGTYDRTPEGKAHHRMLGSRRWKEYAKDFLAKRPLCCCPHHRGTDAAWPSHLVDHIKRPRGDAKLFWDPSNHIAMHSHCHNKFKQSEERGGHGFLKGCDANGIPLSLDHEWNS